MSNRNACVIAGGQCKWGVREASYLDMAQETAKACLNDNPNISINDIDGLLFSSTFVGRRSTQVNTAPVVAERLGIKPSSICARLDVLCAGGSTGILLAKSLVESGMANMILILGCEKLYTPERWQIQYDEMSAVDHDWDGPQGVGPPPLWFSLQAQEHMKYYGTTRDQIASVSMINYAYGLNNPAGHFQKELELNNVLEAKDVAPPLGLFDCCPLSDGAAAMIVTSEEIAKDFTKNTSPVYIRGGAQVSHHSVTANWPGEHLGDWPHLKEAGSHAFNNANLSPSDIDVAQVHDCFSISQIIELEELGFCSKGDGGNFVIDGQTRLDGKIPTNTDGGLLSVGHPFGATGIRQGIEITKQLQNRAINQVEQANFGMTHNLSGANVEHTIVMYGTQPK